VDPKVEGLRPESGSAEAISREAIRKPPSLIFLVTQKIYGDLGNL
jgi:hypothetical protein